MSNINSLLESAASGWKNMQSDAARMSAKWGKTGLLEGLTSEVEKNNMAMILENQAKQLVVEQSSTQVGGNGYNVGQGENWAGVALPLVRKVFGSLSSKEFVSVQPMNLPSGLVFFLDLVLYSSWISNMVMQTVKLLLMVLLVLVVMLTVLLHLCMVTQILDLLLTHLKVCMEQVVLLTQSTSSQLL